MMSLIRKKEKQSSQIHEQLRKAAFVKERTRKNASFKYKTLYNNMLDRFKLFFIFIPKFNWKQVKTDVFYWTVEVFIEGTLINFALWALMGWTLNLAKILAYGIAFKKGVELIQLIKKDGEPKKLHAESNDKRR